MKRLLCSPTNGWVYVYQSELHGLFRLKLAALAADYNSDINVMLANVCH